MDNAVKKKKRKVNLKAKLWKVFSEYIRRKYADDEGIVKCITCSRYLHWKKIHAGHYIAKNKGLSIYFEETNVHPQCPGCNLFHRGNLDIYALELIKRYGENILNELDMKRQEIRKISKAEYLELIETYKNKLKHLEGKEVIIGKH